MGETLLEQLSSRTLEMHGIELFPGIGTPFSQLNRYGAIFTATSEAEPALRFSGWVNYTPIFFKPGTICSVIGGGWILLSRRAICLGGFDGGEVHWNRNAKLALAEIELTHDSRSVGRLSAVLNHFPFPPVPPRIEGSITFY